MGTSYIAVFKHREGGKFTPLAAFYKHKEGGDFTMLSFFRTLNNYHTAPRLPTDEDM